MENKKVFIFLPDGGGLRNFVFGFFKEIGDSMGFEILYWNNSSYSLKEKLDYNEIKIGTRETNPLTALYSKARKDIELNISTKKSCIVFHNIYFYK